MSFAGPRLPWPQHTPGSAGCALLVPDGSGCTRCRRFAHAAETRCVIPQGNDSPRLPDQSNFSGRRSIFDVRGHSGQSAPGFQPVLAQYRAVCSRTRGCRVRARPARHDRAGLGPALRGRRHRLTTTGGVHPAAHKHVLPLWPHGSRPHESDWLMTFSDPSAGHSRECMLTRNAPRSALPARARAWSKRVHSSTCGFPPTYQVPDEAWYSKHGDVRAVLETGGADELLHVLRGHAPVRRVLAMPGVADECSDGCVDAGGAQGETGEEPFGQLAVPAGGLGAGPLGTERVLHALGRLAPVTARPAVGGGGVGAAHGGTDQAVQVAGGHSTKRVLPEKGPLDQPLGRRLLGEASGGEGRPKASSRLTGAGRGVRRGHVGQDAGDQGARSAQPPDAANQP